MIAVDTNILIYAHREDSHFYQVAKESLRSLIEGNHLWAIPWPCLSEFYGITTHPKIYRPPTSRDMALSQIDALLESPTLRIINEKTDSWSTLKTLIKSLNIIGPKIHDARIAAICLDNDVTEIWSADRDFSRFGRLVVKNPLVK